jgi:rod shape determining protein RodA
MLLRRAVKRVDWYVVGSAVLLCAIGLLAQASVAETGSAVNFRKHLAWLALGCGGALLFAFVPPEFWLNRARLLYLLNLALLAAVYFVGSQGGGARRWISAGPFQFQPSEAAKLLLIITLAALLARGGEDARSPTRFLVSFVHMAIPAALVFAQPDLGTALVLVGIWFGMCIVAGVAWRHLMLWAVAALLLSVGAWETGVIKDYQKERVTAFLSPNADPQGAGYQVLQARLAVGTGKTLGKGFAQGLQKEGGYVPAQHTDFIFTVVAEEGGFFGGVVTISAFGFLLYRVWRVMVGCRPPPYRLLAVGVFALWSYHVVVNLAMVLGLFPVVGVPLPLISYGGSSTLVALSSLGLIMGIRAREEKIVF